MSQKHINQEEYFLWKSMIPELRKNIQYCLKEIKQKPIHTIPPDDLQLKINKIKYTIQQNQHFDQQQYIDVIAYFIEQKVNISLLEMADLFRVTFGGDGLLWQTKITQWARLNTFTNSLTIWNVTQFLRNFINYSSSPLQRDFIYQWRQKVQAYLNSLQFIIKKIQRLQKDDPPYTIDQCYVKYHKEKMLFTTFVTKFGMKSNNKEDSKMAYYDEVTVTFQNKIKAEKKLFNFPQATRTIDDMSNYASKSRFPTKKPLNNTLQRYNFIKPKNSNDDQQQRLNQQRLKKQQKYEQLVQNLSRIGKMPTSTLSQLRQQLLQIKNNYRHELQQQKIKFQQRLHEHVVKLTAKKNRKRRRNNSKNDKIAQNQHQQQQQSHHKIQIIDNDSATNFFQQNHYQQQTLSNSNMLSNHQQHHLQQQNEDNQIQSPPPLYYQVIQQQEFQSQRYQSYPMSHATFIHNPMDYFSFEGQPIGNRNIPVTDPFQMYSWINYYVNDREEYEEFMAVSLDQLSSRSSEEESEMDQIGEGGVNNEENAANLEFKNFIDFRAVISDVEWEKLPPEDKMKFDQMVDETKSRWVADYHHQNNQQFYKMFQIQPVYGEQLLPYMIEGSQQTRTKRRKIDTKQSSKLQNEFNNNNNKLSEFEVIIETQQEDYSKSNMGNEKLSGLANEETSFEESRMGSMKRKFNEQSQTSKHLNNNNPAVDNANKSSKKHDDYIEI